MMKQIKEIRDKLVVDNKSHCNMNHIRTAEYQYYGQIILGVKCGFG